MDEITLILQPSGRTLTVPAGTRLYDAVRTAGLPLASSCGADGTCGRCGLLASGGELSPETAHEARVKADNQLDPAQRLSCLCTLQAGPVTVRATYW